MNVAQTAMADSLNHEITLARELIDVLQEEQNQLLKTSMEELEPLVSRKAELVAQLTQHTRSRHENLTQSGYEPNLSGMSAWLEGSANEPDAIKIRDDWSELVSLTQSAKELNRLNGMLISSHMVRNQQALSILSGNKPNTGMYGPDGQPSRTAATPVRSVVTG